MISTLYTPNEVAEKLLVKRPTVYYWLNSGLMKGVRVGQLWRIREEDLEAFLLSHRNSAPEPPTHIPG